MSYTEITQNICAAKIIDALKEARYSGKKYSKASDFLKYIGFDDKDRENGKRMILRALEKMKDKSVRKNPVTKIYEYIDPEQARNDATSELIKLDFINSSVRKIIDGDEICVYFLSLASSHIEYIAALLNHTSLTSHLITMSSTYNGILFYVESSSQEKFYMALMRISGQTITKSK